MTSNKHFYTFLSIDFVLKCYDQKYTERFKQININTKSL